MKFTRRFRSENTSRRSGAAPVGVPAPDSGCGEDRPANIERDSTIGGTAARGAGPCSGGSMSMEDRKELEARSSLVLVEVTNVSRREPCSIRGVPLRSRT